MDRRTESETLVLAAFVITQEQLEAVKAWAHLQGVSTSEVVCDALNIWMQMSR